MNDHSILNTIKVESPHILFQLGNDITFFVFECKSDVVWFRSISFLNVLFKSEDGRVWVNSEFRNLEGGEVVLEVDFDHLGLNLISCLRKFEI